MTATETEGPATDPLQEHTDAIERLARLTVGDDDERFVLVFQSLVNLLDGFLARPEEQQRQYARSVLMRSAEPHITGGAPGRRAAVQVEAAAPRDSVFSDPVFLENMKELIRNRERIIGGIPTKDYPDCVAIGTDDGWCCSGTLVAPNVVVTAAHCEVGGCCKRVLAGDDVTKTESAQVVQVDTAVSHPDYRPPLPTDDIAVLVLAEEIDAKPRPLADATMLDGAGSVRLAGYGNTDVLSTGGYGIRRLVDVPLASSDPKFGADPETEFVAGAPFLDRDSCNGDSGGPAYVKSNGSWYLAGATSRATDSTIRPCGDGGIYTRVSSYEDWIRSIPGGRWI
jgi:hypothetical protein